MLQATQSAQTPAVGIGTALLLLVSTAALPQQYARTLLLAMVIILEVLVFFAMQVKTTARISVSSSGALFPIPV